MTRHDMKNKNNSRYKTLYNITVIIAWVLLATSYIVGIKFHHLTAFYILMGVLGVDVILQIIFWNKF